jgi:hypothetical protein
MMQIVEALLCKREGAASIPDGVIVILPAAQLIWVTLSLQQNFRNISWGIKAAVASG